MNRNERHGQREAQRNLQLVARAGVRQGFQQIESVLEIAVSPEQRNVAR